MRKLGLVGGFDSIWFGLPIFREIFLVLYDVFQILDEVFDHFRFVRRVFLIFVLGSLSC